MNYLWVGRVICVIIILVSVAGVAHSYSNRDINSFKKSVELPATERPAVVDERSNVTVITTQGNKNPDNGIIVAFSPRGAVKYYNATYDNYFDVDPVPNTTATVFYVASTRLSPTKCAGNQCYRNVLETVNLSTGHTTRRYSHVTDNAWHDADQLHGDRVIVAAIGTDQVFIINLTTQIRTWTWDAQSEYATSEGGVYPTDWTHLNDVSVVNSDTIMASPRNMDQVIFINRTTGDVRALGEDDNHDILYEQHNPDYISGPNGETSVLVADSENNRIVEYTREESEDWRQSFQWTSDQLQWPRDADRLPNGHTLITDSNGGRVLEINRAGEVVWSVSVVLPYEAERLETGAESTGGAPAHTLNLSESTMIEDSEEEVEVGGGPSIKSIVKSLIPSPVINGIVFITPPWMGFRDVFLVVLSIGSVICWSLLELKQSRYRIPIGIDVRIGR